MTIYQIITNGVLRDDGAIIPEDPGNRDYHEYLKWVEDGNIPLQINPKPVSIFTDSNIIVGDGIDAITLVVQGEPNTLVTVDVLTGITPSIINIQLDETGNGSQLFSCETSSTVIVFSHGDISVKVRTL